MNMIDFQYKGESLSSHGCMIAYVVTSSSDNISAGSEISTETVTNKQSHKFKTINIKYETPITVTFDIIKNDCEDINNKEFTDTELSWFLRWLNSKTDEKFYPIYDDRSFENIFYYGKFNKINYIHIGGNVIGLTVTFTANTSFGYIEKEYEVTTTNNYDTFTIYNESDEIGELYPKFVKIKCINSGNLRISHSEDIPFKDKFFYVANCESNEIITLDCENKIITSSMEHPKLYNDFNYGWISLWNDWNNNKNVFLVSIPCEITIKYDLIRKVGIVV